MPRKKSAAKKAKEQAAAEADSKPVEISSEKKQVEEQPEDSFSEESSSSEEEDEYGELITEDVEKGIEKVLETIKSDPKKLLDPSLKFFDDPEKASQADKKEKPMYLKDYHRLNLLSGGYKEEDEGEYNTVDGEKPFVVTQREERDKLLSDIKNAFSGDEAEDESDDGFLKKVEPKSRIEAVDVRPSLPDPSKNEDEFLKAFLDNQAWIPSKNDKVIDLDRIDKDDEEQFDDAVEQFEHAYNFRYEDANAAEIVSYARNQATLRRSATKGRKKQREREHEQKKLEQKKKEELLKKKKTTKINKVMDRLAQIKEAVGNDVSDEVIQKVFGESLLNDDFDDADWDSKMAQIFDEQYYEAEPEKPTWDDDDMGEDFGEEIEEEKEEEEEEEKEEEEEEEKEKEEDEPPKKKSKKEKLKEKKSTKKDKESLREKAQAIVEAGSHLILDEVEEERGRKKDDDIKFKYREVSPETFGLTTRDILLADDKQLNSFIGIKKFAPYRPKESRMKDKRKYTKKKHLQNWRKEVFNDKHGAPLPEGAKENEIWIPAEEEAKPLKENRKRKK